MADRYEDQYRRDRGYRGDRNDRNDRNFMERAGDEVRSWFGDDEAERRRQMDDRDGGQFRDRDYGGGSRSGWYEDQRYGQSGEGRGQGRDHQSGNYGSGSYGSGTYGSGTYRSGGYGSSGSGSGGSGGYGSGGSGSYGSGGYGSGGYGAGSGSYYGDRGQQGTSDRSYGYGGRSGGDPFRGGASEGGSGYGGSSWSQREDRGSTGGWFSGRGPKGYQRSDARINEEVCDRLCDSPEVDASEVEVNVSNGEVTLTGSVSDRHQKRRAEDLIEQITGVREVHNNLRVSSGDTAARSGMTGASSSSANSVTGSATGTNTGSSAAAGTSTVTGEQPGNVLGVGGGAPDKASSAGAGRR